MTIQLTTWAGSILDAVCDQVGLDPAGAQLLRLRSNAVFKLNAPIVVRIATSPTAATTMPAVIAMTRWLAEQGFPVVRPADDIAAQPVSCNGTTVTFWHYVPASTIPATVAELGSTLRHLHELTPPTMPLRRLTNPLAAVRNAIEHQHGVLSAAEYRWLSRRTSDLHDAWDSLPFTNTTTIVHGDAWIDNLLRHRAGHVVLCDWDAVSIGPVEWDLIHTYHGERRFGLAPADVDAFAASYGTDLRNWPGYPILSQIRDLNAIGIHIRNAPGDPFSRQELTRRLDSLTEGRDHERWHMRAPNPEPT